MMKLEPMNKEELMASVSPTALSDHIYLVLCSCEYQRHKMTLLDARSLRTAAAAGVVVCLLHADLDGYGPDDMMGDVACQRYS